MKNNKLGLLAAPILTLFWELLPYGAICYFASSPTERVRQTFSYFSLVPYGYANFAPFITAVLSCVVLLLALISQKKSGASKAVFVVSLIGAIVSLLPLLYGYEYYSLVGGLITLPLVIECVFAIEYA